MKKTPLSYIELSKSNLLYNFRQLKNIAKRGTKFSAVVKSNAYGHGQKEIVKILNPLVDYFQVNSVEELSSLRKITKKKTFLFGYTQKDDLKEAIRLGCILSAFSIGQLKEIEKTAKKLNKKQEIHIPVDALLGREGFLENDLENLFREIKKCKNIKVTGIYAHFANIEDTNNFTHAEKQIKKYNQTIELAKKFGFKNLDTHISATSGLLIYEKDKGINNIIRLGIGIYGLWPSEHIQYEYKNKLELKPVLSWKTKVAQVKNLPAGHTIGYGLTYMTYVPTKIAIIPQGYADGFDRGLSNRGEVLIGGTRCKILGRVAMNMITVDVSHLKNIKAEDEVVFIGRQGSELISAEEIARHIDTINYEVVTRVSSLLPRIVK
ncbi:alanine racemase [Patescibacteria group bacterium]|nr:alanine racemase [Patescibacteria group bacterium]MBU1727939.1 alanine racemase [Patescibacteria group bacterium]